MIQQRTQSTEYGYQTSKNDVVTRRFATRLQRISLCLMESIKGIEDTGELARYASLLLYRLLFLMFFQQMGLLAGDFRYLQHCLCLTQANQTNFYLDVLHPLFTVTNSAGPLPLSIARLFTSHEIEQQHPAISLPNEIFTSIFSLFDEYTWQADEQPGQREGALTPEILGTLFEQNLHPKELGTYYTPGAITTYIVRNTLFPALFTRMQVRCAPHSFLWPQLTCQPSQALFAMVRKGCDLPLPAAIAAGRYDVTRRQIWQQAAPEAYALPGETWREVIARREHVAEVMTSLRADIPDHLARMVTWNLDQQTLTLEALRTCQQPDFLYAFYQSLHQLTILDPTCGSGAFLFAALQQLEPLYAACLTRMEELLSWSASVPLTDNVRRSFDACLQEAGNPGQRRATILSWIVAHNLYGVDLREEAVEICRLRLGLKVLAARPNHPCAELPCDFGKHLHVGNSLVGSLRAHADAQSPQADQPPPIRAAYQHVFHWDQAFPEAMEDGGFAVVVGNPPYVKVEQVQQLYTVDGYATMETGNLYALTMERGAHLLAPGGHFGMIVPASATCTDGYRSLQKLLLAQQELHIASFSDQRGHLFALPHPRLCIIFYEKAAPVQNKACRVFTTPYIKLGSEPRASFFEHLYYTEVTSQIAAGIIPRYGSPLELTIARKLACQAHALRHSLSSTGAYPVYYTRKLSWFVQVTPFIPLILDEQGHTRAPSELKMLRFASPLHAQVAFVALNSTLFYWLITTGSDCRNLNMREVGGLPLDLASIQPALVQELCQLSNKLEIDLRAHASMKTMFFRGQGKLTIQCLYPARSKPLLDEADRLLAQHYGFSEEELDFLLHYDEKYRRAERVTAE